MRVVQHDPAQHVCPPPPERNRVLGVDDDLLPFQAHRPTLRPSLALRSNRGLRPVLRLLAQEQQRGPPGTPPDRAIPPSDDTRRSAGPISTQQANGAGHGTSKPDGYLLGSYRIATAPEPNSSRLTSFRSTCFWTKPADEILDKVARG